MTDLPFQEPYVRQARLVRVIDGDTVLLDVDLGFDVWTRVPCRLYGVHSSEEDGERTRLSLELMFAEWSMRGTIKTERYVLIKSRKGDGVWLVEIQGRDGDRPVNMNQELVRLGLAESDLPD